MSIIRAKNAIVRHIMSNLPQGLTAIDAKAKQRTITIMLSGSTVDVLKPENIGVASGLGFTFTTSLFAKRGGEDYSYTEEADRIEDAVKALLTPELCQGFRTHVYWSSDAFHMQALRTNSARLVAAHDALAARD